jgi:hypothetical protein
MRKVYILHGGGTFYASTAQEFVTELRALSVNPERTVQEFMDAVAQRCILQSGAHIRTGSAEHFLCDLQDAHYCFSLNAH